MKLNEFLVKAKRNTYPTAEEGAEKKLEDGSKELIYLEGNFKYRDRYYGNDPFIGEEIVWENGIVVWGMNYYGEIRDNGLTRELSKEEIYGFLKKALIEVTEDLPFRGPIEFKEGDFEYKNNVGLYLSKFMGDEMIKLNGIKIYYGLYHGGTMKQNARN